MDAVEKIYARLPALKCKGLCSECCGPIMFSAKEADRMARKGVQAPGFDEAMTCTALRGTRCAIYANRPYICRLWGAIKSMACPHGCQPARWVSEAESAAHLRALGPLRASDQDLLSRIKSEL
jgi:hypothetical protein